MASLDHSASTHLLFLPVEPHPIHVVPIIHVFSLVPIGRLGLRRHDRCMIEKALVTPTPPLVLVTHSILSNPNLRRPRLLSSSWRESKLPRRHLEHGLQEDRDHVWSKIQQRKPQGRTDLWLVGYSSTVITSRAFQAAMLVPQNRHCQPIIADSLLPKNRKKQQTAEMSMEPPGETGQRWKET